MAQRRAVLIWSAVAIAVVLPAALAATSPLLAWRHWVHITGCFAGVAALALLLVQPLLAGGYLPPLTPRQSRRIHVWVGLSLVLAVVGHVAGLWFTSPADVVDALVLDSPTPFSVWGVVAMWAAFAAALLAALRQRLRIWPRAWRLGHSTLAAIVVVGGAIHALLIEGLMEPVSKAALCMLVLAVTLKAMIDLRAWALLVRRRSGKA